MTKPTTYKPIWLADWSWLEIVYRSQELIGGDFEGDWFEAVEAANDAKSMYERFEGFDLDDDEVYVGVIDHVDERHSLLRKGDIYVNAGYGTDTVFLREIEA